jgi:hypothetical protein
MGPRTLGEARLDAQYAALFHTLNAKLYRRMHSVMLAVELLSGTTAFALIFDGFNLTLGAIGAGFLTAMVIIEAVWKPVESAFQHEAFAKQYEDLMERGDLSTVDAFDKVLAGIHDQQCGIESLSTAAYNRNVVSAGYESWARPLTLWQRAVAALV